MSTVRLCKSCGAVLAVDAPEGLCPQCLMKHGWEATSAVSNGRREAEHPTLKEETGSRDSPRAPAQPIGDGPRTTIRYFGDYELLGEIARGGMGVVYKARQVSLNRVVAVKMILAGQLAGEAEVKRFHTEAEAAANLQHPNIVAIHEVGEQDGQHYFSMDYVAGSNLAKFAREQTLPPPAAARCVLAIAEAIQYAHQHGILHRDLKPQNVLIDERGQPRVTDFGLAKLTKLDSSLTRTGAVLGSPAYMPPEQAAGRDDQVGPASDVYSLGAILYELLTRRAPHTGTTPLETLRHVLEQPVTPPSRINPRVNRDLETICLKCLEKEPSRRYSSARELVEDLARFLNHEPIRARRANPVRRGWSWVIRHPWVVAGVASMVVLLTVGFGYSMWERVAALEWQRAHPNETPPFNADYFLPYRFGVLLFFEFFLIQTAPVLFFLKQRARHQRGNWFCHLFAAIGVVQVLFSFEVLRRGVDARAWEPQVILGPIFASIVALTNFWFGCGLAWMALREARLDLPGIDLSSASCEPPLEFTNRAAIGMSFGQEGLGCVALAMLAGILGGDGEWLVPIFGIYGMMGTTAVVLLSYLIQNSKGLERQAYLAWLPVPLALVATGLIALAAPTWSWYTAPGYHLLGFLVGMRLVQRCPLHRGGDSIGTGERPLSLFDGLWRSFWCKRTAYAAAVASTLLVLFYLLEDLRGLHAWHAAKTRLEKNGERVDWAAFVPNTSVPDNQNAFKHPFMQEYGVRQKSKHLDWFNPGFVGHGLEVGPPIPLATLRQLPHQPQEPTSFAALLGDARKSQTFSRISFTNMALADIIQVLARDAGVRLKVESKREPFTTEKHWDAAGNRWVSTAMESLTRSNATPVVVLDALLKAHHLQPEFDPSSASYKLKSVYTSLAELTERLTRDDAQLRLLEEAIRRPHAQLDRPRDASILDGPELNWALLRTAVQGLATMPFRNSHHG